MTLRHVAVIDIGKTNVKLALVDLESLAELAVVTRPNRVLPGPPYPHFDMAGHWAFLLESLRNFHETYRIDAISVTTHGASGVLLDAAGNLATPVLDYEYEGPNQVGTDYDALRPDFALTGSPRLGCGLNLGAQLHWLFGSYPDLYARTAAILTYPQYWGYLLTGTMATDVTSLGCHTDLWCPEKGQFSPLVDRLRIRNMIAVPRKSTDSLGPIKPDIAAHTGLDPATPVSCGIHDSNASLYPHLVKRKAPFCVVSTGTWVIAMAVGGKGVALDPTRDTLVNVAANGQPVRSARFMGGRAFDLLTKGVDKTPTMDVMTDVLRSGVKLLPAVVSGSGPYPNHAARWIGSEPPVDSPQRAAAIGFYLALMTGTCLRLIGASGTTVIEGAFARNPAFLTMLSAVTGRDISASASATGTSIGAAMLAANSVFTPPSAEESIAGVHLDSIWYQYAADWRAAVDPE